MRPHASATQAARYFDLLSDALFGADPELALAGAAALGREFFAQGLLPEDYVEVHHGAVRRLALERPALRLEAVADGLMAPLMEQSMAYSLAFRRKREQTAAFKVRAAQAGRLEAIGTMAAGIAHDFNTILGVINGYAELLLDEIGEDPVSRDYAEEVLAASMRARDLIVRMLAFARQTPIAPRAIDAAEFVKDAIKMIRVSLGSGIVLAFHSDFERVDTLADPLQIEQIVINLCMNGADAMDGQGKLAVDIVAAAPVVGAGGAVLRRFCIVVTDHGSGMTAEVQRRALDPFFTTKAPGKGSGLGLSVVYGIVADLGGDIQIQSEPGVGTSFHIFLPLQTPAPAELHTER
ncbi:sensor histidine kinase [Massilia sp. DWR3-1-1]|uniref:sensor histidine kinase n=1 Tax=Massilia sp. DWR3-1-1 TaxID=2804559 RepID=UPI003CED80EC